MDNLVELKNGQPLTSSLIVAEKFEKRHEQVLRAIRKIPAGFTEHNFVLSEYPDSTGRKLPMYLMTKNGFSFLCMGFTGQKADEWKIKYIEAFDQMEAYIQQQRLDEEKNKHRFIEAFIKEVGPYRKMFPPAFYEALYELIGWQWHEGKYSHPGYMGRLTNQLIYTKIAPGIYEELDRLNPCQGARRRRKYIQTRLLTDDIGKDALKKQIDFITETARYVGSIEELISIAERKFTRQFAGTKQLSFLRVKYELVGI